MGRKPKQEEKRVFEMPFYCKDCGMCKTDQESDENLKIVHNTGWTHDIFCKKKGHVVYGL